MKRRWLQGVLWSCALCSSPAWGEGPRQFVDFTFKRVTAPEHGSGGGRIIVQIDPEAQKAALAGSSAMLARRPDPADAATGDGAQDPAGATAADGIFAEFWAEVAPTLASAGPASFQAALGMMEKTPAPEPRLAALQEIAETHGVEILKASIGTNVSPALVLAVIAVESAGNAQAESAAGARGLMQLIPATAERFGVEDATDPAQNIKAGTAYLDWLLEAFNQDPVLALAGYNAGENAVRDNDGVPPYAETRAYIPKVLAAWKVARGLCLTPPELYSDGCVFAVKGPSSNG